MWFISVIPVISDFPRITIKIANSFRTKRTNMSQFRDFEGEFGSVKKYSLQELNSDKLIKRLRFEKAFNKDMNPDFQAILKNQPHKTSSKEEAGKGDPNYTFKSAKSKITLVGQGALALELEVAKRLKTAKEPKRKRNRVELAGRSELLEKLERKKHKKTNKGPKLIPMGQETQITLKEELAVEDEVFFDATQTMHTSDDSLKFMEVEGEVENDEDLEMEVEDDLEMEIEALETVENAGMNSADPQNEKGPDLLNESEELAGEDVNEENEENQENEIEPESTNGREQRPSPLDSSAVSLDVSLMKRTIMSQLSGKSFPLLEESSLAEPYHEVYGILKQTIKDYEGHSTLVVGPRGSGKSLIIDRALNELREIYHDLFITIKLNALLHSDDKIALREIARQLDTSSRSGDKTSTTFEQRAISDTFSNILLTLDSNAPGREYDEATEQPVPIVFIIDEIEKFTGSNKQTLLYNLFDLSQSSKIPICVVGVSTKITTGELLEKRVRSRFSQRTISIKRAPTIEDFWKNACLSLTVPHTLFDAFNDKTYPGAWNDKISELFTFPSGMKKVLYKIYFATKSYKDFNNCCMLPVSQISEACMFPQLEAFQKYLENQSPSYAQTIVCALSNLELLLVLAAARWIEKVDVPQVNFNLAYKEYKEMMKTFNKEATTLSSHTSHVDSNILASLKVSLKIWSPKVLRDSWANLFRMGILFDVVTSNNEVNVNNNYNMYKSVVLEDAKMMQLDITLEELGLLIEDLNSLKKLTKL